MPTTHDIREQIQKLDEQIVSLLEERLSLYGDMKEDEDDESDSMGSTVAEWEEMADERGWNAVVMGKIGRVVEELCKSATE
jgi:hypothetical protein